MILHIDMDAFFAAVEQRDNPELKGKPIVICGRSKRSVVSTASYEARKFGIRSAMPLFKAKQLCEDLIIVPGRMGTYQANSRKIMELLFHFSPVVEQVSIDEAYMNIKGCERLFGPPEKIARKIKKQIYGALSLTCSIGIAPVKFLAKIASDMNKPDGLTIIDADKMEKFIDTLLINKVPGVGKNAMNRMKELNINTLGDIKKIPAHVLDRKFGKMGAHLVSLSKGIDNSPVQTEYRRKSISNETTLSEDISDFNAVRHIMLDLSESVGRQLRKKNHLCKTISIKLKFSDFSQITRNKTLDCYISSNKDIFKNAVLLYQKVRLKKKIRLIGVGVSGLKHKNAPYQMQLLDADQHTGRQWETVDTAVDGIKEKFGTNLVQKASLTALSKRRS